MIRHLSSIAILLFVLFLAACQSEDPAAEETAVQESALPETAGAQTTPVPPTVAPDPTAEPSDTWQIVKKIQPEHQPKYAAFMNELFGVTGCGQIGRPSFTSDGGQSWTQPAIGQFCPSSIEIVDGRSIWMCNSFGVFNSQDGGRSLSQLYNPYDGCRRISFADQNNGWSSFEWNVASTNDGAIRWVDLEKPYDMGEVAAIALRTPQDGYVLTYDGILFSTIDAGVNWSSVDVGIIDSETGIANMDGRPSVVMRFLDEQNGIIVVNLFGAGVGKLLALHTADGGQTWEQHLIPLNPGAVYLSHDGTYLTVTEHGAAGGITLLENQAAES